MFASYSISINTSYLITSGIVIGSLIIWYLKQRTAAKYKVGLTYKPNKISTHVVENCKLLDQSNHFKPPLLLSNTHVQTVLRSFVRQTKIKSHRDYIDLPDGGIIGLDWIDEGPDQLPPTAPIVIVLPTLTGSVKTCSNFCLRACQRGYRCVVFNKRGHGGTMLKTPKLQGFGESEDLREAVLHIHKSYPEARIVMTGASAGSGLLVSYLGDYEDRAIVCCGVTVAAGYDMIDLFSKCLPFVYEVILLYHLKQILTQNRKMLESAIDYKAAMSAWNFTKYDGTVYAKFGGQSSALEYWKENNPMRALNKLRVPILGVNSLDDPVCIKENIPFELISQDENMVLLTIEKGGHCGYLDSDLESKWLDNIILEYFDVILRYLDENEAPINQ